MFTRRGRQLAAVGAIALAATVGAVAYASSPAMAAGTGTICSGCSVNERSGPSTGYGAVGSVGGGQTVTITCTTRGQWVDGASLRVRVTCWRRLGENVSVSVQLGDPVVVHGRLYSRDWVDDQGVRRTSYELDAIAVGHDLSRGVDKFARRKAPGSTDMVEDGSGAIALGGELTEPVEAPPRPDDLPPDNELFEEFDPAVYETSPVPPTDEPADGSLTVVGA